MKYDISFYYDLSVDPKLLDFLENSGFSIYLSDNHMLSMIPTTKVNREKKLRDYQSLNFFLCLKSSREISQDLIKKATKTKSLFNFDIHGNIGNRK